MGWSSLPPKLPDEGLYYNQAVHWFDQLGLVRGLANFDFFLIQGSSFHAWMALLNYDEFFHFNDLGGFFGLLFFLEASSTTDRSSLGFRFAAYASLPIILLLITSSSADVIILVGCLVATYELLARKKNTGPLGWLLAGMLLTKISAIVFCGFIGLINLYKRDTRLITFIPVLGLVIHFVKSFKVSGHLLAPFYTNTMIQSNHQVPESVINYAKLSGIQKGFNYPDLEALSEWGLFERLFHFGSMGALEIASVLSTLIVVGILIQKKDYFYRIYAFGLFAFLVIWFWTSPQFRLLYPFAISAISLVLGILHIPVKTKVEGFFGVSSIVFMFMLLVTPLGHLKFLPESPSIASFEGYSIDYLVKPYPVFIDQEYVEVSFNKLQYSRPVKRAFCFYGGFPCNASMLRTYETDSVFYPIMLGESYKDGFGYASIPLSEFDTSLIAKYNAYSINRW